MAGPTGHPAMSWTLMFAFCDVFLGEQVEGAVVGEMFTLHQDSLGHADDVARPSAAFHSAC